MRLVPVLALLLAGCTTQKTVYLPDGKQGYAITCDGTGQSWTDCYNKAGEICAANGYTIVSRSDEQGAVVTGSQYGVFGGSVFKRSMLVACKQ